MTPAPEEEEEEEEEKKKRVSVNKVITSFNLKYLRFVSLVFLGFGMVE